MRSLCPIFLAFVSSASVAAGSDRTDAYTSKYDTVMSVCSFVVPKNHSDFPIANELYPHAAATAYFHKRGIVLESSEPSRIKLLEGPRHAVLVPSTQFPDSVFIFQPQVDYLGADNMIFEVEVKKKKFKVIYSVWVDLISPDNAYKQPKEYLDKTCPNGFSIKELQNPDASSRKDT